MNLHELALKGLRHALKPARHTASRPDRLNRLAKTAFNHLSRNGRLLKGSGGDIALLTRLVRAYARGQYRTVPWRALLYAVAAIVYFVNPIDLIPDTLAVIGFADDVAVISIVVKAIQDELDRFRIWEIDQDKRGGVPPNHRLKTRET